MALGQSAEVVFDVGEQDSAILSVLKLDCETQDSLNRYAFSGRRSVTAIVQQGTSCWLIGAETVSYSYKFQLQDLNGRIIPTAVHSQTRVNLIIGSEIGMSSLDKKVVYSEVANSEEGVVITLNPIAVQQLKGLPRISIYDHVLGPCLKPGSCDKGPVTTYIDSCFKVGSPPQAAFCGESRLNFGGVPAEFEKAPTEGCTW